MNKILMLSTSALLALSACTSNPYTGQSQASKTLIGSAIGAGVGAIAGSLTGEGSTERRQHAIIGAGIGAIAGGGAGYYMDQQEAKLRQQLQHSGVSVTRIGDDIVLNMPGNITFETAQSSITPNFYDTLNSVALVLKEFNQTYVDVTGHTDDMGDELYNQTLSEQRANSVASYISAQGVERVRLLTSGAGELQPIADNATEEGRATNRRVEIKLSPVV